jgi:hypothetical protein
LKGFGRGASVAKGWSQFLATKLEEDHPHVHEPSPPLVTKRLINSDNRHDPGNPLVLDGEAIDAAARDPQAIGRLMVDQVWAEGTDPTGGALS